MSSRSPLADDPILATLPRVRGRSILKPCVLYARLGRGGMGAVYLAKHLTLMQKQVVKCLWLMSGGNPSDPTFVDRFQREARIAAEMTHQNLVRVTHVDRLGELHYLVMEYIEGEDVDRRIRRTGPIDEEAALTVLLGAACGLGYAHGRGIVHRDVKPANLMISTHGEVKVIDLGLARAIDSTRHLGATFGTLGTPLYMAPEQWQTSEVDATADVWALGAVLYYMLTGRSPLPDSAKDTEAIRKVAADPGFVDGALASLKVSRSTRRLLRRCLAHDPKQRYADARELAHALGELVSGDDHLLVDPGGAPQVVGDEPSEDELRALQDVLVQRESHGSGGLDATLPDAVPAGHRDDVPSYTLDPTLPVPAAPTPPRAGAPISGARPSRGPIHRRRRSAVPLLAAAVVAAVAGTAGVAIWPRVDYEAVQRDAMAAIYQERFADADRLLQELEAAPAFADQARRMRIDTLERHARLVAQERPADALRMLLDAGRLAGQLLLAREATDARARIEAASAPIAARLQEVMREALAVHSPLPGAVVTRVRQPVAVRFVPGSMAMTASIQGRALEHVEGDEWRGDWQVPNENGAVDLVVVVELADLGLRHAVTVPVDVRRGAVSLHLSDPPRPCNGPELRVDAAADNGPLDVVCTVISPDGSTSAHPLGSRDGEFRLAVPLGDGEDGTYRLRLDATVGDQRVTSPECTVVVDRRAPQLQLDATRRYCAARTVLLQGRADEPCRVHVVGQEDLAVATDGEGAFAVPVTLSTEGLQRFVLAARDAAGNVSEAAAVVEVLVDRTPPRFDVATLEYPTRSAGERVLVRGRLDEPGEVGGDGDALLSTADDGSFEIEAALPPGAIEQPATLRLVARDRAGNRAEVASLQVFVDRVGPRLLPGAKDGSWWADGYWLLEVEDASLPCRVTLGGESQEVPEGGPEGGIVRFARRVSTDALVVTASDGLGNRSTRTLSGPGTVEIADAPAPGPAWGEPVPGSGVDPVLHLHERVALAIGGERIVMRLVRPLRDEELPPRNRRDPRAAMLLQGQPPFYLAETELPRAIYVQWLAAGGAAEAPRKGFRFDPDTCQWLPEGDADAPLHPRLAGVGGAEQSARWPATQIAPEAARAFCTAHGLRLPTENEWLFVARMGSRGRYGWLPEGPLEQRANLADLGLQALAPRLAAFDTVDDGFAALAPVDAFPHESQRHPWGFRNLLGNVAEWCTTGPGRVVAVGGSWLSEPFELRVDQPRRDRAITSGAWDCVGLRVAKDL